MPFRLFGVFSVPDSCLIAVLLTAVWGVADSVAEESGSFPSADEQQTAALSPRVRVERAGRLLTMDFEWVDAQGRRQHPGREQRGAPPTFTVFKDGRPIGSGSFEYG